METVVEFDEIGGPERLRLRQQNVPSPQAGEVQISLRAAGLNRAELMYLAGQYLVQPTLPSKIGVEGSGIVAAIGSGVSGITVGDEVCILPNMAMNQHGVLATLANVPSRAIIAKPKEVSFVDAAATWMAFATAYGGLVNAGGLQQGSGQVVVITAASSSVGLAAIQIAKAHGAMTIATTRSRRKATELVRAVRVDHIIATEEESLSDRIHELTDGKGFDIAFDPVMGPFIEPLAKAAAREATLVEYGILSGDPGGIPFFVMVGKALKLTTFHVIYDLLNDAKRSATTFEHLRTGFANGDYTTTIDATYPIEKVAEAYRRLDSNEQLGKVVVTMT